MAVISFFFLGDEKIYLYGSITGFTLYSVFFVSQAIVNDQLYTDPNPINRAATSVPVLVVIIISAMNAVVLALMIYFTVKAKEGPGINPKKVRDSRTISTLHVIDGQLKNPLWIPLKVLSPQQFLLTGILLFASIAFALDRNSTCTDHWWEYVFSIGLG